MLTVVLAVLLLASPDETHWLRGNTHAHTLESDGDSTPEEIASWYRNRGYDFLVITDHDKVTRIEDPSLILIQGEEITDRLPKKPLHVNAMGIDEPIAPQKGATAVEVLQRNIDAVRKAGGIATVNHPNFGWAFGSDELLQLEGLTLLEIASGHPYVNMYGPPSVEVMWDVLLTAGKRVWGVAADDAHHLKRPWDTDVALPGKAWIVVRTRERSAKAILGSIREGEFYASTGVEIADYVVSPSAMTVTIKAKNLAHYRTQFIGRDGVVLAESSDNPATFPLENVSGYVRAKVIDSNGRVAWLQPYFVAVEK